MFGKYLTDYDIGQVLTVVAPQALSSDGFSASDNVNGIPVAGLDSVCFIGMLGALNGGSAAAVLQILYASNGLASDAVASNAGFTASDASFSFDSDSPNELFIINFDIDAKGFTDEAGKLFISSAAAEHNSPLIAVAAIPVIQTGRFPVTQENTVVNASSVA
jgi:hypothetical protein